MNLNHSSKLALGTVQFGLPYGIANTKGQVPQEKAAAILAAALAAGVDTLDTAIAYGDSEQVLGSIGVSNFNIVSKLSELPANCKNVNGWVEQELHASLERLKVGSLNALLLHRPAQLLDEHGEHLYQALLQAKNQNLVKRIGVSIYSPDELKSLTSRYQLDLIQAPFNILDNRLYTSGWLDKLRSVGTSVHVRSVFMQGLLVMPRAQRPAKFNRWYALWKLWEQWLNDNKLTPQQACLGYVLANKEFEKVVVGVDSLQQFNEVLAAANNHLTLPELPFELTCSDTDLLNPSLWNNL